MLFYFYKQKRVISGKSVSTGLKCFYFESTKEADIYLINSPPPPLRFKKSEQ